MSRDDHHLAKFDHRSSFKVAHVSLEELITLMSSRFEILKQCLDTLDIQIQDLHTKAERINWDVMTIQNETLRVGCAINDIQYRMRDIDHRVLCLDGNVCASLAATRLSPENPAQNDLENPVSQIGHFSNPLTFFLQDQKGESLYLGYCCCFCH
ncbi:hypothetical protein U1Q18_027754 [Sarracenia purpurea var. burkii]